MENTPVITVNGMTSNPEQILKYGKGTLNGIGKFITQYL